MNDRRRTTPAKLTWSAATSAFLAVLFAFVLPFICWGVLETPGHPHGSVHFVFGQPPLLHASLEAAAQSEQQAVVRQAFLESWCGDPAAAPLAAIPLDEFAANALGTTAPAGRSTPSTALTSMPLLTAGPVLTVTSESPAFTITIPTHHPPSTELSVPTPPPRVVA